ncbi:MAG TPA: hypothetical protein VHF51_15915 [Solirubrobacteraceae bacterium]|nr:hypothetical protein [Solirubrobacteraceae bacterium]
MKLRLAAGAAAAAAALAAPAGADAAVIAAQGGCFFGGQRVPLTGGAFTPGAIVTIGGGLAGTAQADAAGNFTARPQAPSIRTIAPRTITVTATDGANAGNTARTTVRVVREPLATNAPVSGRPRQVTTWRFAGFPRNRPIYGHYAIGGRVLANFRFGRARGPCGTLTVRARRVPVAARRLRTGTWRLQLDNRRTYRRTTSPRRVVRFRIFRAVT